MSNTMIRPEGFENVVGGDEYDKRITAGINGGRGNNNKRIHMTDGINTIIVLSQIHSI